MAPIIRGSHDFQIVLWEFLTWNIEICHEKEYMIYFSKYL